MAKRSGVTSHFLATTVLTFLALSSSSSISSSFSTALLVSASISEAAAAAAPPAPSSKTNPATSSRSTTATTSANAPTATAGIQGPHGYIGVASATSNNAIFFQGGQVDASIVTFSNELFSLDVTKSWGVSTPAWTNLTIPSSGAGGPMVGGHSAAMSPDQSTFYVTAPMGNPGNPFLFEYSVNARTWSTVNAPSAQATLWSNRKEAQLVTDPNSGALWYLGGSFPDDTATNEVDQFLSGTWNANVTTSTVMNAFSSGTAQLVGTKIYIFGGFSSTGGQRSYQNFQSLPYIDISTNPPTVGIQLTLGAVPASRQDHCSVLTASKKVIIYGGYDANALLTLSDVWSLDMVTMTWQQIVTVNTGTKRFGHTCNLVGANMIVYGGMTNTGISYGGDVQVYDVMQSTWMQSYALKQDTTLPSKPIPGGFGSGSGSGGHGLATGALIGIIVGVVALIGIVLGAVLYRRRQRKIEILEAELEKEAYLASLGSDDPGADDNRKRPTRGKHPYRAFSSPNSTSTRHLNDSGYTAPNTPGVSHYALDSPALGGDLNLNGLDSPGANVQYLMQQLPDGSIAVQPVYLDHQPTPSLSAAFYDENSYMGSARSSPRAHNQQDSQHGYFVPPPAIHNNAAAINGYGQAIQSTPPSPSVRSFSSAPGTPSLSHGYVMPPPAAPAMPSVPSQWQNIPLPPPSSHDPFASPVLSSFSNPQPVSPTSPTSSRSPRTPRSHPSTPRQTPR